MPHSAVQDDIHNLADTVRRAAGSRPRECALVMARPGGDDTTVTWSELDGYVDAVASALLALNLPADDQYRARVAIALPNVPEFAFVLFGVLRAGLVAVPVNPGYTGRELHHLLSDSGSSVIIASADVLGELAGVRDRLPALSHVFAVHATAVRGASPFTDLTRCAPAEAAAERGTAGGEDLAVLLYTSGTAGAPKGAMLSHRSLIANHRQLAQVEPAIARGGDVVLLALPLFHAFGLNASLGAIAWHGATGVLVERFDPEESLDVIARHRVSVVSAVPQMYAAWTLLPEPAPRLASVRLTVSGAAGLDRAMARRFQDLTGHQIFEGYGLTETGPVLTTALDSPVAKSGSIGRPIPDVEIRLVGGDGSHLARVTPDGLAYADIVDDFDDDAGGVPGTDPGEIVARGPNLFSGYWPDGGGGPDAEGWWATGDIAYADEDGDLFLVDRLGELVIVNGFNVYPHEIELVLAGFAGVAEAAVVGQDDPQTGQSVKAYVVASPGEPVSREGLIEHCALNLARFKRPTTIEFVSELPHSATGKVRKGTLRGKS
jgi:long-chain acyl-CoA synthetase